MQSENSIQSPSTLPGVNVLSGCEDRFFSYVVKNEGCWEWSAAKDPNGYGRFWFDGQMRLAHHISWLLAGNKPVIYLRHKCNNTGCVNSRHLEPGTHSDNMKDMALIGNHGNRKIDPQEAIQMREAGQTLAEIGRYFDASKQAVRMMIMRHKSYEH